MSDDEWDKVSQFLSLQAMLMVQVLEHQCKEPTLAAPRSVAHFQSQPRWRGLFDLLVCRSKLVDRVKPPMNLSDAIYCRDSYQMAVACRML